MLGPFDIGLVAARLLAVAPAFRLVAGAAELEAALGSVGAGTVPAAYVLLARENATPSRGGSQRLIQQVEAAVSVIIVARSYRQADLGTAAGDDIATLIAAARGAVLGWTPDAAGVEPFELQSGRLEQRKGATLWWQEIYRTRYRLEAA